MFRRRRYVHGATGEIGQHMAEGRRPRSPTHEHQTTGGDRCEAAKGVESVEQPTDHTLDRCPSQLLAGDIGSKTGEYAGGVRAIRRALTVEVRQQRKSAGPGL